MGDAPTLPVESWGTRHIISNLYSHTYTLRIRLELKELHMLSHSYNALEIKEK